MASYSRLLLSTGGGVISAGQQAEQARNTASILIGLGGTGVHCIRTIKTQVYDRLKPDVVGAAVPTYSHIRFLGVDSADTSKRGALDQDPNKRPVNSSSAEQVMPLSENEFFSISNRQLEAALTNKTALSHRKELAWLEYENIAIPDMSDAGAGGIRQIGRFMFMDRSESFIARLKDEIKNAKTGLSNPRVNIHIFSGLSGGTGSGCFLDVCYLVRSLTRDISATIFGYFFLPDVNLWPIPQANRLIRNNICTNGYASMQELDYCMNLQFNGSGFKQTYQGGRVVPWEGAPVDMCHLICATDENNNAIAQAYDYAMNVTAEYLMDFLTDSTNSFDLQQHLSNYRAMINVASQEKVCGYCVDYCVIGAACASVPLREINTYLASELFRQFAGLRDHSPGKRDVEQFCIDAFVPGAQSLDEVYFGIYRQIQAEADPDAYEPFPYDWKFVRDNGAMELELHYRDQTDAKKERYELNANAMSDENNPNSLTGRVRKALEVIIRDLKRGPVFAHSLLSSGEHNLVRRIDDWIQETDRRYADASRQIKESQRLYENAKADFETHCHAFPWSLLGLGCQRRFEVYEFYWRALHQRQLELATYEQLKLILPKFRDQVRRAVGDYYVRLSRVTVNLMETFEENRQALASRTVHPNLEGFAKPMMSVAEIKPVLDAEIRKPELNAANMFNQLMSMMLEQSEEWKQEDESRITRLVTKFLLERAFGTFANRTITNFLRDKYEVQTGSRVDDDQLAAYIYNDWIRPRTDAARPLFYFNKSIWRPSNTSRLAFLSYPAESAPISNAVQRRNAEDTLWGLKTSALTDRIFVMSSACGLPLSAYNNCQPYEKMFYSSNSVGRHYYEGRSAPDMAFNDWRKLPSIMPQSVLSDSLSEVQQDLRKTIAEARELWRTARESGFLNDDSEFLAYAPDDADELRRACADAQSLLDRTEEPDDNAVFDAAAGRIRAALARPMVPTGQRLPKDGDRSQPEVVLRVQEDHFVSSPAFHDGIRQSMQAVEQANALIEALENRKKTVRSYKDLIKDFCNALFTGVLQWKGRTVTWPGDASHPAVTLCGVDDEYVTIPFYQAYLNYRKLPDDVIALMRTEYQRLYGDDAPELRQAGAALKAELTEKRVGALTQIAAADPNGNAAKITRFLRDFVQRFKVFCLDTGI